jgi:DNA-binding response OmpR family regulator
MGHPNRYQNPSNFIIEADFQQRCGKQERDEILLQLWGDDDYFAGRSLDVFMSRLRKYLRHDPNVQIENHHSVGFQLRVK